MQNAEHGRDAAVSEFRIARDARDPITHMLHRNSLDTSTLQRVILLPKEQKILKLCIDQSIVERVSSTTFTFNELTKDISDSFASDRLVALRGYVPACRKARIWLRLRDKSGAAEFRE